MSFTEPISDAPKAGAECWDQGTAHLFQPDFRAGMFISVEVETYGETGTLLGV